MFRTDRSSAALVVALGVCAGVVAVAGLRTSGADFSASTRNDGNLFASERVTLDVRDGTGGTARLFLDGTGLHPGRVLTSCFAVTVHQGTGGSDVRLHAAAGALDDLAPYFELVIEEGELPGPGCDGFAADRVLFGGTLAELAAVHGSFGAGLPLHPADGDTGLRVTGHVRDVDEAQGLVADYRVLIEARP